MLQALARDIQSGNTSAPIFSFPLDVLRDIFDVFIRCGGDEARRHLMGVCRLFRCVVYKNQGLWTDVTTFPQDTGHFMNVYLRSRWTGQPLEMRLDDLNRLGVERLPDNTLLATSFNSIATLVIEHKLATVGVLRVLHRTRHFPLLKTLVLSSDAGIRGLTNALTDFARIFKFRLPTIHAKSLRVIRLRCVYMLLPETTSLTDVRLNARVPDDEPEALAQNKWPSRILRGLIRRNHNITVLHLVDAIKLESTRFGPLGPVLMPALQELVICAPSTAQPAWVLSTFDMPATTHIRIHVGHGATEAFDMDPFFSALGHHVSKRDIRALVALPSFYLTGLLLSSESRSSVPYWTNDPQLGSVSASEVAHTVYASASGAVDIFFLWDGPGVDEVNWRNLFDGLTPYLEPGLIHSVEMNAEYEMESADAFALFDDIWLPNVTELRLWPDEGMTLVETLIKMCTGCHDDEFSARQLVECLLSFFPVLTRIVDVDSGNSWEAESTVELVEQIVASQNM
ncbi:hypothetical protein PENSPDRAFT_695529 [Peniophora sp. CONT]|nr:hypothetical protein PENSPDRAFT_695529 [Peniophora sp. CONT]